MRRIDGMLGVVEMQAACREVSYDEMIFRVGEPDAAAMEKVSLRCEVNGHLGFTLEPTLKAGDELAIQMLHDHDGGVEGRGKAAQNGCYGLWAAGGSSDTDERRGLLVLFDGRACWGVRA